MYKYMFMFTRTVFVREALMYKYMFMFTRTVFVREALMYKYMFMFTRTVFVREALMYKYMFMFTRTVFVREALICSCLRARCLCASAIKFPLSLEELFDPNLDFFCFVLDFLLYSYSHVCLADMALFVSNSTYTCTSY